MSHFAYWNKIFENDFVNVVKKIQETNGKKNGSIVEVYKPIHQMKLFESFEGDQKNKADNLNISSN